MKVKVGDRIYSADDELVMVILTDKDKKNIENMWPECTKYCAGPDGTPDDVMDEFMEIAKGAEPVIP